MQRSSGTIGTIAGALAKVQAQLVNQKNRWSGPFGRTKKEVEQNGFDLLEGRQAVQRCSETIGTNGNSSTRHEVEKLLALRDDGSFALDLQYFRHHKDDIR